ncbi:hypothetical protein [Flavobacterium sp. 2]|uniref:hypothetical protein n=1 Tax=Flavobacterium sp. 2 TaxID=308053 RepID=UPI003CE79BD6
MTHLFTKLKNACLLFTLLLLISSCNSSKKISGIYRSNFAQYGFFVTEVKLNEDSTAVFQKWGDVLGEKLNGKYKISKNTLYLKFNKLKHDSSKDTVSINELSMIPIDTSEYQDSHGYDLKFENGIPYHLKFKIKHNKLLVYNFVSDKIIRRCQGSKNKARFYLKKLDNY